MKRSVSIVMNGRLSYLSVGLPIALGCACFVLFQSPELFPDSKSYLNGSAVRSIGYPLFLDLLQFFNLPLAAYGLVQWCLFALALLVLSLTILRHTNKGVFSASLVLGIGANPYFLNLVDAVLSEALFIPVQILLLAFLVRYLMTGSILWFAFVSTLVVVGIWIRPVSFSFLPLLVLLPIAAHALGRLRSLSLIFVCLLVALIGIFSEGAVRKLYSGPDNSALITRTLFAKAVIVADQDERAVSSTPPLQDAIEKFGSGVREFLDRVPAFHVRHYFLVNAEVFAQYQLFTMQWQKFELGQNREMQSLLLPQSIRALAANPVAYFELTLTHYIALWLPGGAIRNFSEIAMAANSSSSPQILQVMATRDKLEPSSRLRVLLSWIAALAMSILFILTMITMPAVALFRRMTVRTASWVWVAFICSLATHGNFLLVALLGVGLARYTFAMYPALILMVVALMIASLEFMREKADKE